MSDNSHGGISEVVSKQLLCVVQAKINILAKEGSFVDRWSLCEKLTLQTHFPKRVFMIMLAVLLTIVEFLTGLAVAASPHSIF